LVAFSLPFGSLGYCSVCYSSVLLGFAMSVSPVSTTVAQAGAPTQGGKRLKILLVIEACNPEFASVPLEGFRYYDALSKLADVTLITHSRNKGPLEKVRGDREIIYLQESQAMINLHRYIIDPLSKVAVIWQLYHILGYPIYEEFNQNAFKAAQACLAAGEYDLVHAITPMEPRYPFKVTELANQLPVLVGPVNGGVPFPPGFAKVALKEFAFLNFLRVLGRYLTPGYAATYRQATRVLAGSSYTRQLVAQLFKLPAHRLSLFYENGIVSSLLRQPKQPPSATADGGSEPYNLLFVGRLVPYKCADIVIEALGQLTPATRAKVKLTIVGDGAERAKLERLAQTCQVTDLITFAGWVSQAQIADYYDAGHIFCFPSVREYGGAVVLEAMAAGLPCIVVNNGGIGEYVTDETGFRIEPESRQYVVQELTRRLEELTANPDLYQQFSANSVARAQEFTWDAKAGKLVEIYQEMLATAQLP
jgi:glycosyltransferase involved in cell wall biosynthesis